MNKYIKVFNTDTDYQSFISGKIDKPNLSYVKATNEVHYNPFIDYSKEYLTFEALESGTFTLTVPADVDSTYMTSISYSTNNGANWVTTMIKNKVQKITTPMVNAGGKVLWKGVGKQMANSTNSGKYSQFTSTGNFNVSGNIMSMLYGDNFARQTSFASGSQSNFSELFASCTKLISAGNLILPATTLTNSCYQEMFSRCETLTTAPALPATTLTNSCYQEMFQDCTSLATAPALPATTLTYSCYQEMFKDCTSLTTVPELPATTLANSCYESMFNGCTSLTTAPELPATTLADYCYVSMFYNCTLLTTAPELPATTLADYCYGSMFSGCTSLTTAPELPATTLTDSCYGDMFSGCTSLTTAPELPATTLTYSCYGDMFTDCSNLNSITMLATDISPYNCLDNWVDGVSATGTFTKAASMTTLPEGSSGIPYGWIVVDSQ